MNGVLRHIDRAGASPLADIGHQYRAVFDAVNDGIFICNPITGQFIEVNQSGCQMFGWVRDEIIGQYIEMLSSGVHPYTQEVAIEHSKRAFLGEPQTFEWQCKTRAGSLFWAEISKRYTEFGPTPAIVASVRDISERKAMTARIEYMAHYDALTGLANRSLLTARLDQAIDQSHRTGEPFAVLLLDLDHFKDVNDTRGHPIGDRLLQLISERLKAGVPADGGVFRIGGDEFAILLRASRQEEIGALADRLIASVSNPFAIDGVTLHVGASIGVAVYGNDTCEAAMLMTHADIALYRAKAEGRQIHRFYSPTMNEEVRSRVALKDQLRRAIPDGQLFLEYQPQVTGQNKRIVGVEALVRWAHPGRGILPPASFLPLAESSGLIIALDRWVLHEACRQGREWIDAGVAPGIMCVNLSGAHFKQPLEFEAFVLAVLHATGMPAHLLELEITEQTLVDLTCEHREMMQRLRNAGVRFALDDFGTGYSSLNYLRLFAVDRIKIAGEFIADLETSGDVAIIVKCILYLAHALGNEVIAEGVETSEQFRLLQEWDCPDMQGYHFAAPMSAEAVAALIRAGAMRATRPD